MINVLYIKYGKDFPLFQVEKKWYMVILFSFF